MQYIFTHSSNTEHEIISVQKDLFQDTLRLSKVNDKEFSRQPRKNKDSNLQRQTHQIILRFLSSNPTGQERVE